MKGKCSSWSKCLKAVFKENLSKARWGQGREHHYALTHYFSVTPGRNPEHRISAALSSSGDQVKQLGCAGGVKLLGESPTVSVFGDLKHNTLHRGRLCPIWCPRWDSLVPTSNIRTTFISQHFNFNTWITETNRLSSNSSLTSWLCLQQRCLWYHQVTDIFSCDTVDLRNVLISFSVEAFHWQGGSKSEGYQPIRSPSFTSLSWVKLRLITLLRYKQNHSAPPTDGALGNHV